MAKLHEMLHLSSPLVFAELFTTCEGGNEVPWSTTKGPDEIGNMAERRDGLVYFYYNQKLVDWKMERAAEFDEKILIETSLGYFDKIKDIILNQRKLSLEELKVFIDDVMTFWRWFDGVWWAIEYADKNKKPLEQLMKARKETEFFVPGLRAVIRGSFLSIVGNEYEKYIDVLKFSEVVDDRLPQINELEQRLTGYVVVRGNLYNSVEDARKEYDFSFEESVSSAGDVLQGQCAYPGKVQGVVKIVNAVEDMKKFSEGNIIVSSTTTPDFLPIMKISSAIISEHGGVICHAAITSRELKIPCVVGVKKATKILKDGDLVEVDAETGVVRKLVS